MKRKEDGLSALEELNNDMGNKSGMFIIRILYDNIELSLASGVSRETILNKLNETYGRKMTLQAFDKNLYRTRKEIKQKNGCKNNILSAPKATTHDNQTHPETNHTSVLALQSIGQSKNEYLANDDNEDENNKETTSEMEFRRRKKIDIYEMNEIKRRYEDERRENKKREKEMAIENRKNKPNN